MDLLEKIEALKQIKALMEAMQRQPNEQAYQVLSICLNRIERKYQYDTTAAQIDPHRPFYTQLNPQYLNSWLDATTEQEQHLHQQLKIKSEQNSQHTRLEDLNATNVQNTASHDSLAQQQQPSRLKHVEPSQSVEPQVGFTDRLAASDATTETHINPNLATETPRVEDATIPSLNQQKGYTLLAYQDILATPLMPMAEASCNSQTPILVLKERQQLRLIHGVERLRLAKLLNQSHVNAIIIDRQHGFSWQSLRQFIENAQSSIEVEQLYQALTQHTRH